MNQEFLKTLLETASPSGFEKAATELWKQEAQRFADRVITDLHGNSIAEITNNHFSCPVKIMLAGHIDEIGFIVSKVDDCGFVYFQPIGGWDAQVFPGQRVKIFSQSGLIKGCIGRQPIHLLDEEQRRQVVKTENLWIDVGGKEIASGISIGDSGVIDYGPEFFGKDILIARGLDDRIGAFIVLEVLRLVAQNREKMKNTVYAVATVQEELGFRGAITSAYNINPQIGIAVDVTFATDYPGAKNNQSEVKLGAGPVIAIGPNIHTGVYTFLTAIAKAKKIPHQIESCPRATGTDANAIQLSRGGVAAGLLSIPNRYMHSPCEMVNIKDVESAIELLATFCLSDFENIIFKNHQSC